MNLRVELTSRAERDIDGIIAWIAERSPRGAISWCQRLEEVLSQLSTTALHCSLAPENRYDDTEIRHMMFKIRRGKPYRVLFTVRRDQVLVRHVRGPGQDLVPLSDLRGPNG